jgi:hypothetical protein
VLLQCGDQQEFAEARTVHRDRFADEVFDLVDAGIVLGDDRGRARLVDNELREHQRRAGDDRGQCRRGAAAEAEVRAAARHRLQCRGMVRERPEPFDLDAVPAQQLVELAAFFRNQIEAAEAPGQADRVRGAAGRRSRGLGHAEAGKRAEAGGGRAKETAAGGLCKRRVRHG